MIIDNKFENFFPKAMSFVGYFIAILGLLSLYSLHIFMGFILLLIGLNIAFATSGIQINPRKKTYRGYYGLFGLRFGKWKPLDQYKYLTILHSRESTSTYSRSNRDITVTDQWFDIYLLNENHRLKLIIKRLKSSDEATKDIKMYSELLKMDVTRYSPKLSDKSESRRNKDRLRRR